MRLLTCYAKDDGVVVATFDDPRALFSFVFTFAAKSKALGSKYLRMGLHSEMSEEQAISDLAGVPRRGIDIARRVLELGYDGHILATREAGRFAREHVDSQLTGDAGFDALFSRIANLELRPNQPVEMYNVHGAGFGNGRPPRQRVPERVLTIKIPKTLKEQKREQIKARSA